MRIRQMTIATILSLLFVGTAGVGYAFPTTPYWHMPASGDAGVNRAGGEGLYGTGGAQDLGIRCSHCHIDGEGLIDFQLSAMPAFDDVGGEDGYVPGRRYTITIRMTGEHLRPGTTMNNMNGMALAIEDASGRRAGRFIADAGQDTNSCPRNDPYSGGGHPPVPAGRTTFMYGDCHAVLPLPHMGLTAWTFDWIAPAAGAGDLSMFVAVVDGDTGAESSLDDDVVERTVPLRESAP
jgi:hypothetical protein